MTKKVRIWLLTNILPWCLKDVMGISCFKACTQTCFKIWYFLDIFKTSEIMFNWGNIVWEYQQPNHGKRWAKVGEKSIKWLAIQRRPNMTPKSAQRRPNVGDAGLLDKSMLGWHCKADIAPTFLDRLGRRWPNLLMQAGQTLLQLNDFCCVGVFVPKFTNFMMLQFSIRLHML